MKKISTFFFPSFGQRSAENKIKVACIGDSITEGKELGKNTYPAQLQRLLGDAYQVKNFGVSGRTLLKKGDCPYWNEKRFKQALLYQPNIVIILLGTNDSKPWNWQDKEKFHLDYREFIQIWKNLSSQPNIYICYPIPVFANSFNISDAVVQDEIIPTINKIAQSEAVEIIDLYQALKHYSKLLPDGVHPNQQGAGLIAETIYKKLRAFPVVY